MDFTLVRCVVGVLVRSKM